MKIARLWMIFLLSFPLFGVLEVGKKEETQAQQQDPNPNPNPNPDPSPMQHAPQQEEAKVVEEQDQQPVERAQSSYPVIFPPTQEREFKADGGIEYYVRIITGTLTQEEVTALKRSSDKLIEFARKIRPRIILEGEAKSVQNEIKYSGKVLKGEVEQKHEFEQVGDENIKKITARIEGGEYIYVKIWRTSTREVGLRAEDNSHSLSGKKALCLCFNKTNKQLYIGCEDGSISAFDIVTKKISEVLPSYGSPVRALDLMHNDSCLVFRNEESTYVWALDDTWPRIMLENIPYTKNYIFPTKVVRSHSDKSKMMLSYLDGDKVYGVPHGYLQNTLPNLDAGQAACIALLFRIAKAKLDEDADSVSKAISEIYNSEDLKHFDAGIQNAFRKFLKLKAQERGIEIKETF